MFTTDAEKVTIVILIVVLVIATLGAWSSIRKNLNITKCNAGITERCRMITADDAMILLDKHRNFENITKPYLNKIFDLDTK